MADAPRTSELSESPARPSTPVIAVRRSDGDFRTGPRVRPPRTVAGYALQAELGRGGMGVVYKAWQASLKRWVALKMILAGQHARPDQLSRFWAEAEALAQVQHPGIVPIYEVGEHQGLPFFAMELIGGGSLARLAAQAPVPPRRAARLIESVARAVHAAHWCGLIHRDLKPANILLTRDGAPKITDFGLVKNLTQGASSTWTGSILGTPEYMAPEQAVRRGEVSPATDIYSLGAILYELLAGRPPFQADDPLETLVLARTSAPAPPSRDRPDVPRDLEAICLKCLAKEPGRRYPSAEALADDLKAHLEGRPVRAGGPRGAEPGRRRGRWLPLLTAGGVTAGGLGAGALLGGPWAGGALAGAAALACGGWFARRLRARLAESRDRQQAAERNVERLRLALEMTCRLVAARNLDQLLRRLCEEATALVDAQLATVYLIDPQRGELCSKVTLDERVRQIRLPLGVGIAGQVAITGETINLPDAYADGRFYRDIDRQSGRRTRSLLTFALTGRRGRVLGVFQVMNKRSGAFTGEDLELLSYLRRAASVAIERAGAPAPPAATTSFVDGALPG